MPVIIRPCLDVKELTDFVTMSYPIPLYILNRPRFLIVQEQDRWSLAAASVDVTASMDFSGGLTIDFDNDIDPDATVVTITGPDQHNLLLRLTAALNSLGLNVVSASISSSDDGTVLDVFRVTNSEDQKVSTCTGSNQPACACISAPCCPFLI